MGLDNFTLGELVDRFDTLCDVLESFESRFQKIEKALENLPSKKTYSFPETTTLHQWIKEFGPSANDAGISKQLIVNVVQACGIVLQNSIDASTMPPPICHWTDSYLSLVWESRRTEKKYALEFRITPDYHSFEWYGYGYRIENGKASLVEPVSENLKTFIRLVS